MEAWKWWKLLQWVLSNSWFILGYWFKHQNHGYYRRRFTGFESKGYIFEYHTIVRVPKRCAYISLWRTQGQAPDQGTKIWSKKLCWLHSLVLTWSSRYMEWNFIRTFAKGSSKFFVNLKLAVEPLHQWVVVMQERRKKRSPISLVSTHLLFFIT